MEAKLKKFELSTEQYERFRKWFDYHWAKFHNSAPPKDCTGYAVDFIFGPTTYGTNAKAQCAWCPRNESRGEIDLNVDADDGEFLYEYDSEWNRLPASWEPQPLPVEDPRKTGLKRGLGQLTIAQLERVIAYPGEMVLDDCNYKDGNFCPLAIGVGLDLKLKTPTDEHVVEVLSCMGYSVYNTRGIAGTFYTTDRKRDLLEAAKEVLAEKKLVLKEDLESFVRPGVTEESLRKTVAEPKYATSSIGMDGTHYPDPEDS